MKNTKKLVTMAISVSLALILSFIESQIPAFVAVPGVKLGLANIAVVFALYKLGEGEAAIISAIRVILLAILFGSFTSFLFSLSGATVSFILMLVLKRLTPLGKVGVSVIGGVSHNLAQIGVACLILETNLLVYYLPFLLISGTVAGIVIGVVSALLVAKINLEKSK
ncbi:MAG: Gx transporter family protein [Clostridia bacterium]|nr:Gx transporter family protein [Clostridia bacterium]